MASEERAENAAALRYAYDELKDVMRPFVSSDSVVGTLDTPGAKWVILPRLLSLLNQGFEDKEVRFLSAMAACTPVTDYNYHYTVPAGPEHFTGPDWEN